MALILGTGIYFKKSSALLTAAPMTFACWCSSTNATNWWTGSPELMTIQSTSGNDYFTTYTSNTSTVARTEAFTTGTTGTASSGTLSNTGWSHICGVFSSGNANRVTYLNGTAGTANTTSLTPVAANLAETVIGAFDSSGSYGSTFPSNGIIAYAGIWNIALGQSDVNALQRFSPRRVHPEALIAYVRFLGASPEPDVVSSTGWTVVGSPTVTANPPILSP